MHKLTITRTRPNTNVAWYKDTATSEKIDSEENYYQEKYVASGKINPAFNSEETDTVITVVRFSPDRANLEELEAEFKNSTSPLYARTQYAQEKSITTTYVIAEVV